MIAFEKADLIERLGPPDEEILSTFVDVPQHLLFTRCV